MRETIQKLLDSDLTTYRISKSTGITHKTISELRSGKRKLGNITLSVAEKLYNYQVHLNEQEQ